MRSNPIPWPTFLRKPQPSNEIKGHESGLSAEDQETQARVNHYLYLADQFLAAAGNELPEDEEGASEAA